MKTLIILAAAALTGLGAVAATAQTTSTSVSFADLDLATLAGKSVLMQRINRAANMVCGVETGTVDLASHEASRSCAARAAVEAMTGVTLKIAPRYASR